MEETKESTIEQKRKRVVIRYEDRDKVNKSGTERGKRVTQREIEEERWRERTREDKRERERRREDERWRERKREATRGRERKTEGVKRKTEGGRHIKIEQERQRKGEDKRGI